jgi:hypothetical protein
MSPTACSATRQWKTKWSDRFARIVAVHWKPSAYLIISPQAHLPELEQSRSLSARWSAPWIRCLANLLSVTKRRTKCIADCSYLNLPYSDCNRIMTSAKFAGHLYPKSGAVCYFPTRVCLPCISITIRSPTYGMAFREDC